jgi:hypothetical protein
MKTLKYSVLQTQIGSVIPFAVALVLCLVIASVSNWVRTRLPFERFRLCHVTPGVTVFMTMHHSFVAQLAGLCLVAVGSFTSGSVVVFQYVMSL